MENQEANQLPEVDSLPDGFVEGPTESSAPHTPTLEQEKPRPRQDGYRENLVLDELETNSGGSVEKTQKPRKFPVPLADSDAFDASADSEASKLEALDLNNPTLQNEEKEENKTERQSQETDAEVGADQNLTSYKESSHEIVQSPELRKPELTEAKRKNVKRSLRSEKEFLEFTLKYQQVLAERDAAIAVRDKLESLCRELQRQNKMLMDECKRVSTEGQTLRSDLSAKFQDAMKEVGHKLEEQKDECLSQLKENEMLRNKLKQLADQYALSEQQFAQKLKQKTLELQLSDLRIQQHEEKLVQERAQMKVYAEQVSKLLDTEKNLRLQSTADGEKFQQVQDALLQSKEVFETFKQEIEKVAKSNKELKKENVFLKSKCEKSDVMLIELVEQREGLKKQLEKTKKQKEKLESLCRSLQAERKQSPASSNISDIDTVMVE